MAAITHSPQAHTVRLRPDVLRPAMKDVGIEKISTLLNQMGMSRYGLNRVVLRNQTPGARFIGSLCIALDKPFDALFEIVPESEVPQSNAAEEQA